MADNLKIIHTRTLDPWWNLAIEEYLLDRVEQGQCILYLWQNENTVVIGRNQNPWRECRTEQLEIEGGKLARRLSGGGAVFHDTGNLNFTFITDRKAYDLKKQLKVILHAVNRLGIKAEINGRNDITASGRKFSGNAFCFRKNSAYHHGTVLVSADFSKFSRYLQVSSEKMKSKGIQSIKSRVINLSELKPGLAVDEVAGELEKSFQELYGCRALTEEPFRNSEYDRAAMEELYGKYSSWNWRYGETPKFDVELEKRFPWGGVEIGLRLENGIVAEASVFSDAMDELFIAGLPEVLKGCVFSSKQIARRLRELAEGKRVMLMYAEDNADMYCEAVAAAAGGTAEEAFGGGAMGMGWYDAARSMTLDLAKWLEGKDF